MSELARRADQESVGQSTAQQAQQKVQEKAVEVRGQVSDRFREQVDMRSTQVGEQLASMADAMWRTGGSLRDEGNDAPARVTDTVAERAERLGGYLRDSDADAILRDVENLARRQPWLFAAGGLALGLLASRFLKASSAGRYRSENGSMSGRHASSTETEPDVVSEPDVELDSPAGVGHGT
jgi:hypothetical protein